MGKRTSALMTALKSALNACKASLLKLQEAVDKCLKFAELRAKGIGEDSKGDPIPHTNPHFKDMLVARTKLDKDVISLKKAVADLEAFVAEKKRLTNLLKKKSVPKAEKLIEDAKGLIGLIENVRKVSLTLNAP